MNIVTCSSVRALARWLAIAALSTGCTGKEPAWTKAAPGPAAEGRAPNFVLVTIDTLRADAVGAYGAERKTRNLDAFAKQALVFENAFATAPFTGPSHASILTSRHPSKHGVVFNGHRVKGKASTDSVFVSEHLKKHGYATAAIVSAPSPAQRKFGFGRGFDHFHDKCRPAHGDEASDGACVIAEARRWLENRPKDHPFFLWVHLFDPHFPYICPPEVYEKQGLDPKRWVVKNKRQLRKMTNEDVRKAYLADVYEGDLHFGELMNAIADLGLRPGTVVAVTSDHGEYLGERGFYDHHRLYDEVLQVPLMISAYGRPPARRSDLVSTMDLVPTALEILGVPAMPSAQGRSALDIDEAAPSPPIFAEWRHFRVVKDRENAREGDFQLGVRTSSNKLVADWLFPEQGSMLFDLRTDPEEANNLFSTDAETRKRLTATLEKHIEKDIDPKLLDRSDIEIDPETMKMLKALGYVE